MASSRSESCVDPWLSNALWFFKVTLNLAGGLCLGGSSLSLSDWASDYMMVRMRLWRLNLTAERNLQLALLWPHSDFPGELVSSCPVYLSVGMQMMVRR